MITALYVDDEEALLDLGAIFLERQGAFAIKTALSAEDALEKMRTTRYDAIISDYQMPGMNGIDFLKNVRSQYGDIPFILFTGKGREAVVIEAINNGADFYLQKGGDPTAQFAELGHKIRTAVERRQGERALKDSEQRLADIINFLPDATFAIDTSGTVIAWNKSIEEMTGVTSTEMLGKGNHEYALPFYGHRRRLLIDLTLESEDEIKRGNYALIKKEGTALIAEATAASPKGVHKDLLCKGSLLRSKAGEVIGAIESIRDITEARKAEDELRAAYEQITASEEELRSQYDELKRSEDDLRRANEQITAQGEELQGQLEELVRSQAALSKSEQNFQALVEQFPDAIYISQDERFVYVNPAMIRLMGAQSADQLIGMSIYDRIHPEYQHVIHKRAREVIEERKSAGLNETVYLKLDGTPVQIESAVAPIMFRDRFAGVAILRDITLRKKNEHAIEAANRKLNLLSSITRHDIRNKITILAGYLELAKASALTPVMKDYLDRMERATQSIREHIEFTKIYQDLGNTEPRWQNLEAIMPRALVPSGITIQGELLDVSVYADPILAKVFSNLLDNTLRHGENVSTIRISSHLSGDQLIVVWEDDGTGVPPTEKEKIFDQGYGKNTGLGLFLAREILGITGITIRETGTEGAGARFEIAVPMGAYRVTGTATLK
jgi:PAS domain S-box-containing protein